MASNLDLVAKLDLSIQAFTAVTDLLAGGEGIRLDPDRPEPLWCLLDILRVKFIEVRDELDRRDR